MAGKSNATLPSGSAFTIARRFHAADVGAALGLALSPHGDIMVTRCHNIAAHRDGDEHPSLRLGRGAGSLGGGAKCFACGWTGDGISLCAAIRHIAMPDAARWIVEHMAPGEEAAARDDVPALTAPAPAPVKPPPPPFPEPEALATLLAHPAASAVRQFLAARGLFKPGSGAWLTSRGVGALRRGGRVSLAFGYHFADGVIHYLKVRAVGEKKFYLHPPCPMSAQPLYGMTRLLPVVPRAVIVEGEIDALTLELMAVQNVVSLPQGSDSARLVDLAPLDAFNEIFVATDDDEAGEAAFHTLVRRLHRDNRSVFRLVFGGTDDAGKPVRYKDANDALVKGSFAQPQFAAAILKARHAAPAVPVAARGHWADGAAAPPSGGTGGAAPPPAGGGGGGPAGPGAAPPGPGRRGLQESLDCHLIPAALVMPESYVVTDRGTIAKYELNKTTGEMVQREVLADPVVPIGKYEDISDSRRTSHVSLVMRAYGDTDWRDLTERNDVINLSTSTTWLSSRGASIPSHHGRRLTEWLHAVVQANAKHMKPAMAAGACGWYHVGGVELFALGSKVYGPDGVVAFPSSILEDRNMQHLDAGGDRDRNVANLSVVLNLCTPASVLALASFASPLLSKLDAGTAGFLVHLWSQSSKGKTSALAVAQSVWGSPPPLMSSWNATSSALQLSASTLRHLPMTLDEFRADSPAVADGIVYHLCNGTEKLRSTKDSKLRRGGTWKLIALSTGERPVSDASTDAGMRARLLELHELTWGQGYKPNKVDSHRIEAASHYGHAGIEWIKWLLKNMASLDDWKRRHRELARDLIEHARFTNSAVGGHPFLPRVASHVAVLAVTAELLVYSKVFGETSMIRMLDIARYCMGATSSLTEAARPGADLVHWFKSWVVANASLFDSTERREVAEGRTLYGFRLEHSDAGGGGRVGVMTHVLQDELKKRGASVATFIDQCTTMGIYEGDQRPRTHLGQRRLSVFSWADLNWPIRRGSTSDRW